MSLSQSLWVIHQRPIPTQRVAFEKQHGHRGRARGLEVPLRRPEVDEAPGEAHGRGDEDEPRHPSPELGPKLRYLQTSRFSSRSFSREMLNAQTTAIFLHHLISCY